MKAFEALNETSQSKKLEIIAFNYAAFSLVLQCRIIVSLTSENIFVLLTKVNEAK